MYQVIKRDGKIVDFDISKISAVITKAFEAQQMPIHPNVIDFPCAQGHGRFRAEDPRRPYRGRGDSGQRSPCLCRQAMRTSRRRSSLYRKQREKLRNMKSTILDYKETVNNYVNVNDWRVKENSTVTYSVGGLILSNSGAITAKLLAFGNLRRKKRSQTRTARRDIHLHDLSMLTGYCAGWSLKQLIQEGLGGIPGKITSSPASHLSTLCNQMVNFLGIMQNEWAGAQAFSSFDTYLAPFVKIDHLSYKEVKQCIQSFVYGVNTPSRWGTQAPFSNITLDCPSADLAGPALHRRRP